MRLVRLCLLLLLASNLFAQEKVIPLRDFHGLNTRESDMTIKPNEARNCINLDFGRSPGDLSKRRGFDSIAFFTKCDSLTGLYGVQWSDGRIQLAWAADTIGKGYGEIYVGNYGSVKLDSGKMRWNWWNCQNPTRFTLFCDRLYAVNGMQKGFVWDGIKARSFPLNAPGEPRIVPVSAEGSTCKLSGVYRYSFFVETPGGMGPYSSHLGYISQPINVDGHVRIGWFPFGVSDSIVPDTLLVRVHRTKANPGRLTDTSTVYALQNSVLISDIKIVANSGFTTWVEDSVPDTSLTTGFQILPRARYGKDSLNIITRAYGSPGYNTCTFVAYDTLHDTGRFVLGGIPKQKDTAVVAVVYRQTWRDTITNSESDTGKALFVWGQKDSCDAHHFLRNIRINLPPCGEDTSRLVRRIWRSHRFQIAKDTSILLWSGSEAQRGMQLLKYSAQYGDLNIYSRCYDYHATTQCDIYLKSLAVDTVMEGPSYLLKQLPIESLAFTDSIRYDSLLKAPMYNRMAAPVGLKGIFAYNDFLFGWKGSQLYWTKADSGTSWGQIDVLSINRDDGDEITSAYVMRNCIRVLKNHSAWNVYQDADGGWSRAEVTKQTGCIAGRSHATGPGGEYYLSDFGVIQENEGQFLERTQAQSLLSAKLCNLDSLPITVRRNAYGFCFGRKYILDVGASSWDSAYVYDEQTGNWTIWTNMKIGGATLYRAASQPYFVPADTMYFYKRGGKTIYRFGSTEKDVNSAIYWSWQSPVLMLSPTYKVLTGIGVQALCDTAITLGMYIFDSKYQYLTIGYVSTDLSQRYWITSIPSWLRGFGFSIKVNSTNNVAQTVDGLDVYYNEIGQGAIRR